MRLTLLGTGTSFGIPQVGCECAVCTSTDPRDRRSRTSALVHDGDGTLLIDTPPELRLQLVEQHVAHVDAVLYTHDHADHTHGIDDLRALTRRTGQRLPAYGPADTMERMAVKFAYIFDPGTEQRPGTFNPELTPHALQPGALVNIAGVDVLPIEFDHAGVRVFGYRFGPVAYVTDVKSVTPEARALLAGVRVLVLSALLQKPHPAHLSIPEAVGIAEDLGVERTWLTHLTHRARHAELAASLPSHVQPASDGLVIEIEP